MRRHGLGGLALGMVGLVALAGLQGCGPSPSGSPAVTTEPTPIASPAASGSAPGPTPATPGPSAEPTPSAPLAGPFTLTSEAFADGAAIPQLYTCDGANTSPPLRWIGAPAGTVTFSLIVTDPDAGGFVHWVVYDMDPATSSLAAGISASTAGDAPSQGQNSFGKIGYGGPCPPSGTHRYVFRLIALDYRIELRTGGVATESRILAAAAGHTLGEAILTGTYRRH